MIFDGQSGWRSFNNLVDRNNLVSDRRFEGMTVYVKADFTTYKLKPGAPLSGPTTNSDWEVMHTTGSLVQTPVRDSFVATSGQLVYVLSYVPNNLNSIEVEYNGTNIYLTSDWTLLGNTLTLNPGYTPLINAGDTIVIDYTTGTAPVLPTFLTQFRDTFTPTLGQLVYVLSYTPSSVTSLEVEYNGNDIYETRDWTLVGNTLTLNGDYAFTVSPTDTLVVDYTY